MRLLHNLIFLSLVFFVFSCVSPKKENTNNVIPNLCGNGVIDPGEQCDDGNNTNHDGCSADCMIESFCGNGKVEPGEECDDGNYINGDGCDSECQTEVGCGNGKLDLGEECDDDNLVSGDGCSSDCMIEGDGPVCGNGILEYNEGCDDGNNIDGDGCSADCQREDGCGNGDLDPGEECDDGNNINGDGCNSDCRVEYVCGNDVCDSELGERCDNCPKDCCPKCGNGKLDPGEECDDGNNISGDGCSMGCRIEGEGPVCGNGVIEIGEECDDGNLINRDGCSDECTIEFTCGNGVCESSGGETCQLCPFDCCPSCGNNILQPGEQCDTNQLAGATCEDFGFTGGELGCTNYCEYSFVNCEGTGPVCGNGIVEYGEQCDGANLSGQDCLTLGFLSGTLFCQNCRFATAACSGLWRFLGEDFEGDTSDWTIGGSTWQMGTLGTGGPAACTSGTRCAATNLNGQYAANMTWTGDCLTSPVFSLVDAHSPVLFFNSWWETEVSFDGGRVQVYSNGQWVNPSVLNPPYNRVLSLENAWGFNDRVWKTHEVDMDEFKGQANLQLRFCFRSDGSGQYAGWYIDDIELVDRLYMPISFVTGSSLGTARAEVPLNRTLVVANGSGNFTFSFVGSAPAWLTLNSTTGELGGTPAMADLGTHIFTVRAVDTVNAFNITQKTFSLHVADFIFFEDFEGDSGSWTIGGSVWQVGLLGSGGPAACASGSRCAATNLGGNYNNNMAWATDCLTSEPFSLAGTSEPVMFFKSWWYTEVNYDGGRVQVFHGGQWKNPVVTPAYNKNLGSEDCWAYNDQVWKDHEVELAPYAGDEIRVRFCFRSDSSGVYAGWYLDDIEVRDRMDMPVWITTGANLGNALVETPFSRTLTTQNGSGDFTFSFVGFAPAWLTLNPSTGQLSGTPGLDDLGPVNITIHVVDNVNPGNQDQKDFTLQVLNAVLFEDFSGGLPAGWTIGGSVWQVGILGSGGPSSCPSHPHCAGTNLNGNYGASMAWDTDCLITGNISLEGLTTATLTFQNWWYSETGYDGGRVQVQSGGNWVNPAVTPAYNNTAVSQSCWSYNTQTWNEHSVNLTPYVGQTIRLRFCFASDSIIHYAGWYIDDLLIVGN